MYFEVGDVVNIDRARPGPGHCQHFEADVFEIVGVFHIKYERVGS